MIAEVSEGSAEGRHSKVPYHEVAASRDEIDDAEEPADDDNKPPVEENVEGDVTKLTGRKKKLFELRLKMVCNLTLNKRRSLLQHKAFKLLFVLLFSIVV